MTNVTENPRHRVRCRPGIQQSSSNNKITKDLVSIYLRGSAFQALALSPGSKQPSHPTLHTHTHTHTGLNYMMCPPLTQSLWPVVCQLQIGTCQGCLPSTSKGLNRVLLKLLTFSTSGSSSGGEQKRGTLCSGKNWQDRWSDS